MRYSTLALALCGLCLTNAVPAADKPKTDHDKLQGTWQIAKAETSGMALPDDVIKNLKLTFKGDKLTVEGVPDIAKDFTTVTFKLDSTTKPKLIDLKVAAGDRKDDEMEGIYEFKSDDEFKFCIHLIGKDRPADFGTKEGDQRAFLVLKRVK